jgi:hypothetical protein
MKGVPHIFRISPAARRSVQLYRRVNSARQCAGDEHEEDAPHAGMRWPFQ